MCEINDIPKHRKKKVKKIKKSSHKHIYKDYLLFDQLKKQYFRAKACSICGKVYEIYFIETKKLENFNNFKNIQKLKKPFNLTKI